MPKSGLFIDVTVRSFRVTAEWGFSLGRWFFGVTRREPFTLDEDARATDARRGEGE